MSLKPGSPCLEASAGAPRVHVRAQARAARCQGDTSVRYVGWAKRWQTPSEWSTPLCASVWQPGAVEHVKSQQQQHRWRCLLSVAAVPGLKTLLDSASSVKDVDVTEGGSGGNGGAPGDGIGPGAGGSGPSGTSMCQLSLVLPPAVAMCGTPQRPLHCADLLTLYSE